MDLDSQGYRMVDVQGLPDNWVMLNGIVSSVSTIFAPGSHIDDGMNVLIIIKSTDVEVVVGRLLDTHGCTKEGMMDSHIVVSQVDPVDGENSKPL